MGVKAPKLSNRKLLPAGPYVLKVVSNSPSRRDPLKVRILLTVAHGPHTGLNIPKNFPLGVSANTNLGKLIVAAGFSLKDLPDDWDLDNLNGRLINAVVRPHQFADGTTINSVDPDTFAPVTTNSVEEASVSTGVDVQAVSSKPVLRRVGF